LPYTIENAVVMLQNICQQPVPPDGLQFDAASVRGEAIQGRAEHEGVRLRFTGYLGNGRLHMQIDVGFSDGVTPSAIKTPLALTDAFAEDKQKEWAIFIKRTNIETSDVTTFTDVIKQLNHFLCLF
jgi:hypothetical protein